MFVYWNQLDSNLTNMFSTLQVCSYNRLDIDSILLVRLNSNLQLYNYLIILKSRNSNIQLINSIQILRICFQLFKYVLTIGWISILYYLFDWIQISSNYLIILKSRNSNIQLSKNEDYQSHSRNVIASLELRASAPAPAPKISPSAELQITPEISIAIPDLRTSVPFSRVST